MPKLDILKKKRGSEYRTFTGIRQRTEAANRCIGCGMCATVCPNEAIGPEPNPNDARVRLLQNDKGEAWKRGGRRNVRGSLLDRIMFNRISMLTDPALDAGRHEFQLNTGAGDFSLYHRLHVLWSIVTKCMAWLAPGCCLLQ
jgi:glutamate synthase (NADPH/NADH) large chain